jgi:LysM repeat protein
MYSDQYLSPRCAAGWRAAWPLVALATALAVVAGCSSMGRHGDGAQPTAAAQAADTSAAAAEPDLTATEAATVTAEAPAAEAPGADATTAQSVVNPGAPQQYTVKTGDTLWGIANLFLRDPWLWPEIWQINPQVQNPHLIYPGDVLALAYAADGKPQVRLVQGGAARLNPRLRSESIEGPIATIPYSAIASFLARPTVLSNEQIRSAPHVLAFRDDHMIGGSNNEIYVRGLRAQQGARYSVVHLAERLRDPESHRSLGYQGVYTATALVTRPGSRRGEPAKAVLTDSARETLVGDRLVATDTDVPLNFVPRAPRGRIDGQIISVVNGVQLVGQYQVVVLNRGRRHGLEPGHVLAINQRGGTVRDVAGNRLAGLPLGSAFASHVHLPDDRAGTLLVFKTYDRMSYGLVVAASNTIRIADRVGNP